MSTLLTTLKGSMTFNRTIFPPYLFVYDDLLIYRKRRFFVVKESTISYNQVSQVNLIRGILFSEIEIITTGEEDIRIRYVPKDKAKRAKKIIDQKLFFAHAKHKPEDSHTSGTVGSLEKSLNRLKELLNKGQISKSDYERKKKTLLRRLE